MADRNFQMMQRNADNTGWDNLFPITKAVIVAANDGTTMEAHHADSARHITTADQNKTGKWTVIKDTTTGILPNDLYAQGQLEVRTSSTGPAVIGFHRTGGTATALFHKGAEKENILRIKTQAGTEYSLLHEGWQGHGFGINADKVDNLEGSQLMRNDTDQSTSGKVLIKGGSGLAQSPSITLALGDGDTGINWASDGNLQLYANNTNIASYNATTFDFKVGPTVNGSKIWTMANDGAGSGLDADTVDALHVNSTYLTSGSWIPTMTANTTFEMGPTLAMSVYKSNIDSNGIFTTVDYRRPNGTLAINSVLSGGTSPQYTTRTEKYYGTNGTTLLATKTYAISYDTDGNMISEVTS